MNWIKKLISNDYIICPIVLAIGIFYQSYYHPDAKPSMVLLIAAFPVGTMFRLITFHFDEDDQFVTYKVLIGLTLVGILYGTLINFNHRFSIVPVLLFETGFIVLPKMMESYFDTRLRTMLWLMRSLSDEDKRHLLANERFFKDPATAPAVRPQFQISYTGAFLDPSDPLKTEMRPLLYQNNDTFNKLSRLDSSVSGPIIVIMHRINGCMGEQRDIRRLKEKNGDTEAIRQREADFLRKWGFKNI